MSVLTTIARPASGRCDFDGCKAAETKRHEGGVVRGGQMAPQAHINPCDPGGPGM